MVEIGVSKRVIFPKGEQLKFLNSAQGKLSFNNKEMSQFVGKNARTLADWKREKFSLPLDVARLVSKKSGVIIPTSAVLKGAYWYVSTGASLGGRAVYKKYGHIGGNEEERKRKWNIWWDTKGKFEKRSIFDTTKLIKKPIPSASLAEFVGIILGDGGISERQVVVTLHRYDDKEYSEYIRHLINKLFCVTAGVYKNKKALADNIVISRIELVRFLVCKLGLKIGSKVRQQVDVPLWIKDKKLYRVACLRGLVDTDGCVIKHHYVVKNKEYYYKKLSFTNASMPLLQFVFETLGELGMSPRVTKNRKEVRLESQYDIKRYFCVVGSNNPKHLNRRLN